MFLHSLGDRFQNLQNTFLEEHYKQFDNSDENKFEYTAIHKDYVSLFAIFIYNCWI